MQNKRAFVEEYVLQISILDEQKVSSIYVKDKITTVILVHGDNKGRQRLKDKEVNHNN